jgi:hypothetical protein
MLSAPSFAVAPLSAVDVGDGWFFCDDVREGTSSKERFRWGWWEPSGLGIEEPASGLAPGVFHSDFGAESMESSNIDVSRRADEVRVGGVGDR